MEWTERTAWALGREAVRRLERATVAVFGLGGVGSYAAEALTRAGVGRLIFIDGDVYQPSNLNRQLGAKVETVGHSKAAVTAARALSIRPDMAASAMPVFYTPETAQNFPLYDWDFIIDAMDMVTAKIHLIVAAQEARVPVVACMGTGNKLDAGRLRVGDLRETSICPLARVMRRELTRRGIHHLPVVWSDEPPRVPETGAPRQRGDAPGSVSFVPPVAGMLAAGYAIRTLAGV
jgi:tRNA A37 threonylcarbamoyladenosine dehydratase